MKFIYIFIAIFLFACVQTDEKKKDRFPSKNNSSVEKRDSVYQSLEELCNKTFVADSGYVLKIDAAHFLLAMRMTDSAKSHGKGGPFWDLYDDLDTFGKYYRNIRNQHFILCLEDLGATDGWETHVLSEFDYKNGIWNLIAKQRYHHGNYPSCWPNNYDGFEKHGELFSISLCGTGSGFSSTNKQFFSTVVEHDWNNTICTDIFQSGELDFDQLLSSRLKISNQKMIVDYTYSEENDDSVRLRYSFRINYDYKDGILSIKDSTILKKYKLKLESIFF